MMDYPDLIVLDLIADSIRIDMVNPSHSTKNAYKSLVCQGRLLHHIAYVTDYFSIYANSVDPDQTAPRGAV